LLSQKSVTLYEREVVRASNIAYSMYFSML